MIQLLDFIFYKILPELKIIMSADFAILAQGRSRFHLSALEATFIKASNPALCRKETIRVQLKDCGLMTLCHWSFSSQSRLGFFR